MKRNLYVGAAFVATLTGSGVTSNNGTSLWMHDAGGLTMIAREGDQAPGLPAGRPPRAADRACHAGVRRG